MAWNAGDNFLVNPGSIILAKFLVHVEKQAKQGRGGERRKQIHSNKLFSVERDRVQFAFFESNVEAS